MNCYCEEIEREELRISEKIEIYFFLDWDGLLTAVKSFLDFND